MMKVIERMEKLNEHLKESGISLSFFTNPENEYSGRYGYAVNWEDFDVTPVIWYEPGMDEISDEMLAEEFRKRALETREVTEKIDQKCKRVTNDEAGKEMVLSHVEPLLYPASLEEMFSRNGYAVKKLGGFAILFRVMLNVDREEEISFKLRQVLLDYLGVTVEELYCRAVENIGRCYEIVPIGKLLERICIENHISESNDSYLYAPNDMYVVSRQTYINGAAVVLNRKVLESLQEIYRNKPFYLLPSSIHEMIAVRGDLEASELKEMVESVNQTILEEKEYLSDDILYSQGGQLYQVKYQETGKLERDAEPLVLPA